jgi:hypothetical protein
MSFFQWLREGVRQAVVLGLADAVEDVGDRAHGEDLGVALAENLRQRLPAPATEAAGKRVVDSTAGGKRRRLGRSLDAAGVGETTRKAA